MKLRVHFRTLRERNLVMNASAMTTENATNKFFFVLSNKEYYHWYFKDLALSATRRLKELINWIIWNHDSKDHKLTRTLMQPRAKIIEYLYFSSKGDKDTEMMKIRRNCWQLRWKSSLFQNQPMFLKGSWQVKRYP